MDGLGDPFSTRLTDAILSLQPTAYWPMDEGVGNLRDPAGGWTADVTGSPAFGVAAPSPIGRCVTWSGSGQYATSSGSVPVPTASISVACLMSTTDATAAGRYLMSRYAASNRSWTLSMTATHAFSFTCDQAAGAAHVTAVFGSASNDGRWYLVGGTFDGTTAWGYLGRPNGVFGANSSGALTGSWKKDSTAGIGIAQLSAASLFPGSIAHVAYWADRVLTAADFRYLTAVAQGG